MSFLKSDHVTALSKPQELPGDPRITATLLQASPALRRFSHSGTCLLLSHLRTLTTQTPFPSFLLILQVSAGSPLASTGPCMYAVTVPYTYKLVMVCN